MANRFAQFLEPKSAEPVAPAAAGTPAAAPPANRFEQFVSKPAAPAAPKEDIAGQLGAGVVTGLPNMLTGLMEAQEVGRNMGAPLGMDMLVGMGASAVKPLLPKDMQARIPTPTVGDTVRKGLSAAKLNPNDYFAEPTTGGERIARMAGEGAITSLLPFPGEGKAKLIDAGWEVLKNIFAGGVGGAAAQGAMELAPDEWDAAAGLVGGLAGGVGGYGLASAPGAAVRGAKKGVDYLRPAVPTAGNVERLAAQRLGEAVTDPAAAIKSIESAETFVPGSKPTAFQASGDVGLGSLERAMARGDEKFKAALIDRVGEQNAARVAALESIEDTGDVGAAVQFFRDRMRTLEEHADTLYDRAEQAAKGAYEGLGDQAAGDVGEAARQAIAARFKEMNGEASALWESIDPDKTLSVVTEPLVNETAKIYGRMSPEEMLSLSPDEKAIAGIIGSYGETLPFSNFKDLRSEITRAMRKAKSFADPNDKAWRRLSMLRGAVEQAVEDSVAGKFATDASLADQFVKQAKEWYDSRTRTEPQTNAVPLAATGTDAAPGPVRGAKQGAPAAAVAPRGAGAQGVESRPTEGGARLPENAASTAVEPESAKAPIAERETFPVDEGAIQSLDPMEIGVDARRFQFKEGGDEAGVTDRLQGVEQWDPRLAGTALVFRDAQGRDWVADGHQRMGLAKRLMENGHPPIRVNAFVLDAANGVTDAEARAIAAIKNVAEGTGTAVDAAKVMRAAKETGIDLPPLPPRSTLVRDGRALAELSPDAFGMVINEVVPASQGAIVGRLVKDPLQQEEAVRLLATLKPDNVRQAEMVVRDMLSSGTEQMTRQGGLFGEEAFAGSVTLERAKIADAALQQIKQDKRLYATLVNEAERIEGSGNVLAREANETRLTTDEKAADLLQKLAFRAGPVSDELTRLARALKAGDQTANAAARDFLGSVRRAVEGGLDEGPGAGGAGARAIEETDPSVTPRDPDTVEMFQDGGAPVTKAVSTAQDRYKKAMSREDQAWDDPTDTKFEKMMKALKEREAATDMFANALDQLPGGIALRNGSDLGAMVTRDSIGGKWRVTYFDKRGFSGHSEYPTRVDAIRGAIRDGYSNYAPNAVRAAMGEDSFKLYQSAVNKPPIPHTESPAFKRWFGKSEVVDENGKPLVVYHGTGQNFDKFSKAVQRSGHTEKVFFFTDNTEVASDYAGRNPRTFTDDGQPVGGNVMPVYLSLKRPLEIDAEGTAMLIAADDKVIRSAKRDGHDGLIVKNTRDGASKDSMYIPQTVYVAFEPTQIKSTANRGTFDPNDPRILMQGKPAPWRPGEKLGMFDTEPGLEGLPQAVIPGVAPIDDTARMRAAAAKPLKGGEAPPPRGGLFDEGSREFAERQGSLFQSGERELIRDTMADRFAAAGRPPEEALAAGAVVDSFYTTMAQRTGKTVDELMAEHPLPVVQKGGDVGAMQQSGKQIDWTPGGGSKTAKIGSTTVDYAVSKDGKTGEIILVKTPPAAQRQGFARVALQAILREADKNGTTMFLNSDPMGKGASKAALDRFYKSLGFVKNAGKNKDFASRAEFVRQPQRTSGDLLFQPAYHGSPHVFDKFDSSKIGTGEGAQVYGYGLYFAGKKEVAQHYRDALAGKAMEFSRGTDTITGNQFQQNVGAAARAGGKGFDLPLADSNAMAHSISQSIVDGVKAGDSLADMRRFVKQSDWSPANKAMWESALTEAQTWKASKPGRLYKVDIPDNNDLMAWDAPLSEQPPAVKRALNELGQKYLPPEVMIGDKTMLAWEFDNGFMRAPEVASEKLRELLIRNRGDVKATLRQFRDEMPIWIETEAQKAGLLDALEAESGNVKLEKFDIDAGKGFERITGKQFYDGLIDNLPKGGQRGRDVQASNLLREAGVPGHRYVDQGSRIKFPEIIAPRTTTSGQWEVINLDGGRKVGFDTKAEADAYLSQAIKELQAKQSFNYVIYDDSKVNIAEFEQNKEGPRGSIQFGDTGSIIKMFESADASTAVHEAAHHFLKMFRSMAEGADVPEVIAKDWRATKAWWDNNAKAVAADAGEGVTADDVRRALRGVSTGDRMKDLAIDRGFHEQWARGFEQYLRDGKAPNKALRGIFEQFKNWLTNIYQSAMQLNVKLSPEIREVFDRMLATDESRAGMPKMMDEVAAKRFSRATAATREIKDVFGAKPVKQILRRPGPTYPYDMSAESVANTLFKPGPEGAAAIKAAVRAGAPKETIEAAAVASLKRAAAKDGTIDPAKLAAWRQKHADALREVPELDRRMASAGQATSAMVDIAARRKEAIEQVQRSAVGKLLKVEDDADVSAVIGRMLGRDTAVKDMRSLVTEARNNPAAMAGLRRAVVEHMVSRLKTPKDALRSDTFQRYLGKNAPALSQVLTPEQMGSLRAIALDLKRASRDVRAPGGGSDTAENTAAMKRAGLSGDQPSIMGQIVRRALASGALGWLAHSLQGPIVGAASGVASFLGGTVLQALRARGIAKVDDLVREAILDPELMRKLLAKAPKRSETGSADALRRWLGQNAFNSLAINAGDEEKDWRGASPRPRPSDATVSPEMGGRG